jgi:hypothetical protein
MAEAVVNMKTRCVNEEGKVKLDFAHSPRGAKENSKKATTTAGRHLTSKPWTMCKYFKARRV